MKKNNPKTKIFYKFFSVAASAVDHDKRISGTGHVCVVVRPLKNDATRFRVAFSFKSPADKLNRELGVRIANGRLQSRKKGRSLIVTAKSVNSAFTSALETMFTKSRRVNRGPKKITRPLAPDWLHEAVVGNERSLISLKN